MRCAPGGANEGDWPFSREIKIDLMPSPFVQALALLRDDRGSGKGETTWLTMHVVSNTSHASGPQMRICRRFVGWVPILAGMVPVPLPQLEQAFA
jgi:hypothetical protein